MKEIRIGTAVSTSQGLSKGFLKVGELPDGQAMEIPVLISRGAAEGPTLWLHGCVHGNEFCGAFTIQQFMNKLDVKKLSGTVVGLPMLNITGSLRNQRMSPFEGYNGGDLNRCFPGRANGTVTEQMAHEIYRHLREHADYLIDFHTALTPDTRWALFANAPGKVGEASERMARAFGFQHTLPSPMDILAGSAMITAANDGVPSLIVEAGGVGPAFSQDTVDDSVDRLNNVLRRLEMAPGQVTDYGPLTYFSNFAWVNSTRGGLFRPVVKCGDRLKQGELLGNYYDLYGEMVEEAKAPHPGIVLAINPGPLMPRGDILVHIGLDPRPV
jgi:uncharacterized protein